MFYLTKFLWYWVIKLYFSIFFFKLVIFQRFILVFIYNHKNYCFEIQKCENINLNLTHALIVYNRTSHTYSDYDELI